jgi:hypothetical protein
MAFNAANIVAYSVRNLSFQAEICGCWEHKTVVLLGKVSETQAPLAFCSLSDDIGHVCLLTDGYWQAQLRIEFHDMFPR